VPVPRFLITTFLGLTVKGFIYASIAHNAATMDEVADLVNLKIIGLLLVLAALFLAGNWILKYGLSVRRKRKQ
jgi:membrane protein DedA with SNARE-associated domain